MAQLRVPVCYDISRYLTDKYFDIVWALWFGGATTLGTPQMNPPKNQFFLRLNLGCQSVLITADI